MKMKKFAMELNNKREVFSNQQHGIMFKRKLFSNKKNQFKKDMFYQSMSHNVSPNYSPTASPPLSALGDSNSTPSNQVIISKNNLI